MLQGVRFYHEAKETFKVLDLVHEPAIPPATRYHDRVFATHKGDAHILGRDACGILTDITFLDPLDRLFCPEGKLRPVKIDIALVQFEGVDKVPELYPYKNWNPFEFSSQLPSFFISPKILLALFRHN
ncbi:MAG: hypothetical protein ACFFDF_11495 [Candidatus Odinarchaeota archaeon]